MIQELGQLLISVLDEDVCITTTQSWEHNYISECRGTIIRKGSHSALVNVIRRVDV